MSKQSILFLLFAACAGWNAAGATNATVSGLSAGAFQAVQLQVAYADLFRGAGVIAGGPFGCAEGQIWRAIGLCMREPEKISGSSLRERYRMLAKQGLVSPETEIAKAKVYVFAGAKDTVVRPAAGEKTAEFFTALGARVEKANDLPAGHGFPTLQTDNPCEKEKTPWLVNCGSNTAAKMLAFLTGESEETADWDRGSLKRFSQVVFDPRRQAGLAAEGFVYLPRACSRKACPVHLALHGCRQSEDAVGTAFAEKAGYLEWAERHDWIVVFPQLTPGPGNPNGCWDWFGYTGADYSLRTGVQPRVLRDITLYFSQPDSYSRRLP